MRNPILLDVKKVLNENDSLFQNVIIIPGRHHVAQSELPRPRGLRVVRLQRRPLRLGGQPDAAPAALRLARVLLGHPRHLVPLQDQQRHGRHRERRRRRQSQ